MGIKPTEMFLSADDLAFLTGYKQRALQTKQLRAMGIPFVVNACGDPVVAKAVFEGKKEKVVIKEEWVPKWAKGKL